MTAVEHDLDVQVADVVRRLNDDGYAIVERVVAPETAAAIAVELRTLLDGVPSGRNFFEGFSTRRLYAPFAKTRVLDDLALHPLVLGALEQVLGEHFQLSGPTGIEIAPGERNRSSIGTRTSIPSHDRTHRSLPTSCGRSTTSRRRTARRV